MASFVFFRCGRSSGGDSGGFVSASAVEGAVEDTAAALSGGANADHLIYRYVRVYAKVTTIDRPRSGGLFLYFSDAD